MLFGAVVLVPILEAPVDLDTRGAAATTVEEEPWGCCYRSYWKHTLPPRHREGSDVLLWSPWCFVEEKVTGGNSDPTVVFHVEKSSTAATRYDDSTGRLVLIIGVIATWYA